MKWNYYPLKKVAPSATAKSKFGTADHVWHLNLDQIESHTGDIIEKKMAPASSAGNSTYVFDTNNVLYSKLRPYLNKVVCPEEPGIATTELVPLCPQPQVLDRKFLAYFLRSSRFLNFASMVVTGAKMPRVIMAKFWDHEIPLPTPSEQQRIVEILDQADRLRRLRTEADKKAERILPALFHKMFGDPLINKKRFPVENVGDLLILIRNGTTADQNQNGRGYPVTRIETISNGVIDTTKVRYIELNSREADKWKLDQGDILFSHINSEAHIGKTAIYDGTPDLLMHGMNLLLMRPNQKKIVPEYLFALLNTSSVRTAYRQRCKRAVNQASLNQQDISSLSVAVAPLETQKHFCKFAKGCLAQISKQVVGSEKTQILFNILLHRAFSGDLTASWREAHMKELLQEMELQAKALAS